MMQATQSNWVFGYGSLIWNPEIDYEHAELARVHGYHRAFCIHSHEHRGTPELPGVVLGLDRGGSCVGMAFRLRPASKAQSLHHLHLREMHDEAYVPTQVALTLASGIRIHALAYVANRLGPLYQRMAETEVVRRLLASRGKRGPNIDYLFNTVASLHSHGVRDPMLQKLAGRLATQMQIE